MRRPNLYRRLQEQYKRRPMVAWASTAVAVGLVAALTAILVVNANESEVADVPLKCVVADSDGSTVLSVHGKVTEKEADEGCDAVAAKLSGGGRYWRVGLPPAPSASPDVVCGFNAPPGRSGTLMVEVNPEGLTSTTAICGQLAHEGWTQFTQGGVMGPWQQEYSEEQEFQEEAEAAERRVREQEEREQEEVQQAIYRCQEEAEATEQAELKAIGQETRERVAGAASESEEFAIEEEGYELEEAAWERQSRRAERCEAEAAPEPSEEFR